MLLCDPHHASETRGCGGQAGMNIQDPPHSVDRLYHICFPRATCGSHGAKQMHPILAREKALLIPRSPETDHTSFIRSNHTPFIKDFHYSGFIGLSTETMGPHAADMISETIHHLPRLLPACQRGHESLCLTTKTLYMQIKIF